MYLFFDTETSGLPKSWKAPPSDVDIWPHAVQVGWVLCKPDGSVEEERDAIVKPDGWTIPDAAARVHGITTERALSEGVDAAQVLQEFAAALARAQTVVAHNLDFDRSVIQAEFIRAGITTGGTRPALSFWLGTRLWQKLSDHNQPFRSPTLKRSGRRRKTTSCATRSAMTVRASCSIRAATATTA